MTSVPRSQWRPPRGAGEEMAAGAPRFVIVTYVLVTLSMVMFDHGHVGHGHVDHGLVDHGHDGHVDHE